MDRFKLFCMTLVSTILIIGLAGGGVYAIAYLGKPDHCSPDSAKATIPDSGIPECAKVKL